MDEIIKVENLSKSYGQKGKGAYCQKVLDNLNLDIYGEDFIAIMGPSGSGKSTLLKIIGLIDNNIDSGDVFFLGKNIKKMNFSEVAKFRREKIGYVFQDFKILPSITILDNIVLPNLIAKKSLEEAKEKALRYLDEFEISNICNKYSYEISGGELQRVAIIRSLMNDPDIIFADEPTGNLDSDNTEQIIRMLKYLNDNFGKTIVIVTHNSEFIKYVKKVFILKEGKLTLSY
ncbi:ABC transporter ATP-binding protein [Peptoniphilus sp. HMSC062D09]|uniref:ABC transporter ATP-binding protein n=1 Tax=Peptoniphilus sp. HMSC062D09 TaxID=1739305 RepID=UPI0008A1A88D|nr:ABC transporter ATP-binding protein [Peptoniphilus sp. HMSC062D09]OFK81145.1 hypothetical protein HMPREF2801_06065 [Peptoniphilus sp. HMSC062D09]